MWNRRAAWNRPDPSAETVVYDLRVTVDRVEGRSACGLQPGDYFDLVASNELRLPDGKHFCIYALAATLPLLAAKQRQHPPGDWIEVDTEVCCPDPEERLIMRIERTGVRRLPDDRPDVSGSDGCRRGRHRRAERQVGRSVRVRWPARPRTSGST